MSAVGKFGGIAKQLARVILVLVLVTFGVTVIVRLLPGDPVTTLLPFGTPEQHAVLRKELGLDVNIFQYYLQWLWNFVRGDFGQTYTTVADGGVQVRDQIALTLPRTLFLMGYTIIFSLIVSIPLGILLAYKADTRLDKTVSNVLFGFASIPNFGIGLGLAYLLGVKFDLLNPVGYVPMTENVAEHFKSMIMPVLALSIGLISTFTRLLRTDTIATLKEDFVTMASSKGLSNKWILWRHVLRPSSLTLLTSAALNMGALIGGAVVVESVFAFDGLGTLIAYSINFRQYLAIQSLIALVAVSYILFNLIVDVLYGIVDPRVRSHRGG
ncbi:MAG: ABC transporter permease [Actinobacteria bacterium]|jgi:peptide/nickel transport system permease protein|nr:ABC transporter permease [Actinomycetota bacterium]NDC45768.1 ABC transporter permease [Actinomycetota bacterium]